MVITSLHTRVTDQNRFTRLASGLPLPNERYGPYNHTAPVPTRRLSDSYMAVDDPSEMHAGPSNSHFMNGQRPEAAVFGPVDSLSPTARINHPPNTTLPISRPHAPEPPETRRRSLRTKTQQQQIKSNGNSREIPSHQFWEGDNQDPDNMINLLSQACAEKQAEIAQIPSEKFQRAAKSNKIHPKFDFAAHIRSRD
ncbi:hypothetical protein CPB86DRAFT_780341 [Serendipita vermifera]|nr:hypothetical protein CPB86DRAFT_780341 [Serendipita vermifera]